MKREQDNSLVNFMKNNKKNVAFEYIRVWQGSNLRQLRYLGVKLLQRVLVFTCLWNMKVTEHFRISHLFYRIIIEKTIHLRYAYSMNPRIMLITLTFVQLQREGWLLNVLRQNTTSGLPSFIAVSTDRVEENLFICLTLSCCTRNMCITGADTAIP